MIKIYPYLKSPVYKIFNLSNSNKNITDPGQCPAGIVVTTKLKFVILSQFGKCIGVGTAKIKTYKYSKYRL